MKNTKVFSAALPAEGSEADQREAKRRIFTGEFKQRILAEADQAKAEAGRIGALLRREGLYSSHLVTWRHERSAGILHSLTPQKRGPESKRTPLDEENQKLRRVHPVAAGAFGMS